MAGYNKCVADPAGALNSMKNLGRNPIPDIPQELTAALRRLPRRYAFLRLAAQQMESG